MSISSFKIAFVKKKCNKKYENKYTKNTALIYLNLGKRNTLIVLHMKFPKLNDKKNIGIVVKMLQVNDITPKTILIPLR